jgi:hypothetical protein
MRSACIFWSLRAAPRLGLLSVALAGCASEGEALEKRLAKLQEEVTRVQAETDRMAERLDAMELRQATQQRAEERVASAEVANTSRPKLKVVRVESIGALDDANAEQAPADDSGPRVIIQGEGKSLETRSVPGTGKSAPKFEPKSDTSSKSDGPKKSEASKSPAK